MFLNSMLASFIFSLRVGLFLEIYLGIFVPLVHEVTNSAKKQIILIALRTHIIIISLNKTELECHSLKV